MNIEEIKLSPTAILEVKNPLSGKFEGATIEVFNRYSDEYRTAVLKSDIDSISNNIIDLTIAITKEIKGFKLAGKELSSSKEDIKTLYTYCPFLLDDIDKFFSNNDNFFLNK